VAHEFSTPVGRNFHGEISVASIGDVDLAAFQCDEARVVRSQRCLRGANDDDVLLCRQISGSVTVHQDGRDAASHPGDMYIVDPRRPFALGVVSKTHALVFKIPRSELQARLGEITSFTASPITRSRSVAALASDFLKMIAMQADGIDQPTGGKVAQQALDLLALAFEPQAGAARLASTRTTTLLRLKAIIEERIYDAGFKPAIAAAAAGISMRYANALLAKEETSLERFIMLRRLHHCRQALENRAQVSQTVGEIAYSCGFSDLSHFTRRFKALFGCAPGEFRRHLTATSKDT
jgi:AraC family transcriptional regulator, positive regulator of tynA and feaB